MLFTCLLRDSAFYNYKQSTQSFTGTISTSNLMIWVDPSSYIGSGNIWNDKSVNGNNMTISGATFSSNSFTFNGINSYIYTPNIYTLFTTSNSNYSQTQEIWFKSSNPGCILSEQNAVTTSPSWYDSQIELVTSSLLKGRVWNQLSPYSTISSSGPFTNFNYVAWR